MSETARLWSVTTLIKLGLGTSDTLVNWAVRTTAEAAFDRNKILAQFVEDGDRKSAVDWLARERFQKSGVAMARGTDLHRAAEARAVGQEPKIEHENLRFLEQFDRFLAEFRPKFLLAEAPVYSPTYGYAGTLDAVMEIEGQVVVADIKTTPHGPDSEKMRPPYPEAALQLVAYRHAELVGLLSEQRYAYGKRYYVFDPEANHEPMPETEGAIVICISPEDYRVMPVKTDETVWTAFRHVMECARWQVEGSKDVFGPEVRRSVEAAA